MKMKKQYLMILIVLLAILLSSVAAADNFFTMHWEPGEYKVTFSPEEDKLVDGILEEARKKSEGTIQRKAIDGSESVDNQYQRFLEMSPDGEPMESVTHDDIGTYYYAVGLPDEQSITKDEAWKILVKFLLDQEIAKPDILAHYYPQVFYETGNDPENPVWRILLICYDYQESGLPFTKYEVFVYAHDGSICGYRDIDPVG